MVNENDISKEEGEKIAIKSRKEMANRAVSVSVSIPFKLISWIENNNLSRTKIFMEGMKAIEKSRKSGNLTRWRK